MNDKKKKVTPDNARVDLPLPRAGQPAALITRCRQQVSTVKACSQYGVQSGVQSAATALGAAVDTLETTVNNHGNAVALAKTLAEQAVGEEEDVVRLHGGLVSALNIASKGDKATAMAWTGQVKVRAIAVISNDAPLNVAAKPVPKMSGEIVVSCKADPHALVYLIQQGTDPAHPESWPPPVNVGGCKYHLSGQAVGQKLCFRVAIFRRSTGQSQWSDVVTVVVK